MYEALIKVSQVLLISSILYLILLHKNVRCQNAVNDSLLLLNKTSFSILLQNSLKHPYSLYDISTLNWSKKKYSKWEKKRQKLKKYCKNYHHKLTFYQCLLMYEFWLQIDKHLMTNTCPIGIFESYCTFSQVRVTKADTQRQICEKIQLTNDCLLKLYQNNICKKISPMSNKYKRFFQREFPHCSITEHDS
ncbi:unnamed protein product [Didymodactylos carnosus]|uniref:Uncharacterized protein n=1 Tax=Didymodactylos carnosus TaxID=1234261 RepID=A0A813QMX5_9BILA|nr:unnamed protein product [Didymodactylos carnosus]CAF0842839.1 unnamed protein product [Didymodactylos carnosus]CAF3551458.1 unnamed protein product [Didymodactylos carnosus]CAF3627820.1 unnamed protein product [Didymodactylos carnosus]